MFSGTLDWALRITFLIAVPAAVGLFILAGPILATIFYGGAFDVRDVTMAEYSLQAFALGLIGFSLVKVLAPGYFARQDTRTPVRYGVIALGTNASLNIGLVLLMLKLGFEAPHAGLALATGVASMVNAGLLYRGLRRAGVLVPSPGWGSWIARLVAANGFMAIIVLQLSPSLSRWLELGVGERIGELSLLIAAAVAAYLAALWATGVRIRHLRIHH